MFSATMPKAAINEYSHALLLENKVGAAKQREVPPPTLDPVLTENLSEANFGFPVSLATNRRHHFGALAL